MRRKSAALPNRPPRFTFHVSPFTAVITEASAVRNLLNAVEAAAVTLWVGGLWVIGYVAAPTLFANLSDRMLAGALAGSLFSAMAWVSFACGGLFLAVHGMRLGAAGFRQWGVRLAAAMLVLAAAGHFGVQPVLQRLKEEVAPQPVMESWNRDRFAAWHGVSGGLYLVQSLLGLALVVRRVAEAG